jgi:hypothetical protein
MGCRRALRMIEFEGHAILSSGELNAEKQY